eukprot:TRINITY_DN66648_c1_g1_i2.p2 TRINITY_DN66648_c1_g1~~TRINITY_DN66648_c1_g1_i2.p2  ORF type:complete len:457 (+),score=216.71 TRINITY_DN66648_c1_g1_i2:152-1522(+)
MDGLTPLATTQTNHLANQFNVRKRVVICARYFSTNLKLLLQSSRSLARSLTQLLFQMIVTLTHLSDYSYMDRGICDLGILIWSQWHVYKVDGFKSLQWKLIKTFRLKSLATTMVYISLAVMVVYDTIATKFKYEEGFSYNATTGAIKTKSKTKYSQANKDLLVPTDMLLNISWSLKNSAVCLLLAMYHHVARKECGRKHFMHSWEFKCYSIYSIVSIVLYPFLQLFFDAVSTPLMSTIMPQFVYSFECFAIVFLMVLTNWRLQKMIDQLKEGKTATVVPRLMYFIKMNKFFMFSCFLDFIGLFTIDILINKQIAKNKFATDFLTRVFNLGFCFTYIFIIYTLYPEPAAGQGASKNNSMRTGGFSRGPAATGANSSRLGSVASSVATPRGSINHGAMAGYKEKMKQHRASTATAVSSSTVADTDRRGGDVAIELTDRDSNSDAAKTSVAALPEDNAV